jgi:hypothetical protein
LKINYEENNNNKDTSFVSLSQDSADSIRPKTNKENAELFIKGLIKSQKAFQL